MTNILSKITNILERFLYPPSTVLSWGGSYITLALMLLVFLDVFLRFAFNRPMAFVFETSNFMLLLLAFFALGYTTSRKGHVGVTFVVERFSPRIQAIISSITNLISILLFIAMTWASLVLAQLKWSNGITSVLLRMPVYPFVLVTAVGYALVCLMLLIDLLRSLNKAVRG